MSERIDPSWGRACLLANLAARSAGWELGIIPPTGPLEDDHVELHQLQFSEPGTEDREWLLWTARGPLLLVGGEEGWHAEPERVLFSHLRGGSELAPVSQWLSEGIGEKKLTRDALIVEIQRALR